MAYVEVARFKLRLVCLSLFVCLFLFELKQAAGVWRVVFVVWFGCERRAVVLWF